MNKKKSFIVSIIYLAAVIILSRVLSYQLAFNILPALSFVAFLSALLIVEKIKFKTVSTVVVFVVSAAISVFYIDFLVVFLPLIILFSLMTAEMPYDRFLVSLSYILPVVNLIITIVKRLLYKDFPIRNKHYCLLITCAAVLVLVSVLIGISSKNRPKGKKQKNVSKDKTDAALALGFQSSIVSAIHIVILAQPYEARLSCGAWIITLFVLYFKKASPVYVTIEKIISRYKNALFSESRNKSK